MARPTSTRVDPVEIEQLHQAGTTPAEIVTDLQLEPLAIATALKNAGRPDLARPYWSLTTEQAPARCRCGDPIERPGASCGRCIRVRLARARRRHRYQRATAHRAWLRHQPTAA